MTYIFQPLKSNCILHAKDKVAIITPIFTPYLEIPVLPEYNLEVITLEVEEDLGRQLSKDAIKQLEDPAIKVLYLVNPSNPPSVKMSAHVLNDLPDQDKAVLDERYSSLTKDISGLKFIDRLVADSRAVALNHTAGVSLPQQLQMTLFALSALIDTQSAG